MAHLEPIFLPSYHWFSFSSGDFDFFMCFFFSFMYMYLCSYLPWIWWDSEKVQIKVWREAPQMQAEGTACLSRWRRRELSHN